MEDDLRGRLAEAAEPLRVLVREAPVTNLARRDEPRESLRLRHVASGEWWVAGNHGFHTVRDHLLEIR